MENKIAKTISYLFHPITLPTYAFLILLNLNSFISNSITIKGKLIVFSIIVIFTLLLPLLFVMISLKIGVVKSWFMESKEERILPYLVTGMLYYLSYHLLTQLQILEPYNMIILGATFLVVVALIINFWWKISIHMISIGGILGTFIGISISLMLNIPLIIIILTLCSGLVGYARLQQNEHKPSQIYSGFLIGLSIMMVLFLYMY